MANNEIQVGFELTGGSFDKKKVKDGKFNKYRDIDDVRLENLFLYELCPRKACFLTLYNDCPLSEANQEIERKSSITPRKSSFRASDPSTHFPITTR